jgi:hypothetical protein
MSRYGHQHGLLQLLAALSQQRGPSAALRYARERENALGAEENQKQQVFFRVRISSGMRTSSVEVGTQVDE